MARGPHLRPGDARACDQELRRQYLARGYYGVSVKTTVTPLERNRVRITISVDEGSASSIASIRFTGNQTFESDELLDMMQLGTPNWMSGTRSATSTRAKSSPRTWKRSARFT